jgi:hypothetical protein
MDRVVSSLTTLRRSNVAGSWLPGVAIQSRSFLTDGAIVGCLLIGQAAELSVFNTARAIEAVTRILQDPACLGTGRLCCKAWPSPSDDTGDA